MQYLRQKSIVVSCFLVFFLTLLYMCLYIPNQYFDLHSFQDFDFINDATTLSFSTMAQDIFYPGLTLYRGEHAQGVRTRTILAFFLKEIHAFFGWDPFPYYFFKAIVLSSLCVVLFLLLWKSTASQFFSYCGVLFFLSLPSLFESFFFFYDFDILVEVFILLSFLLFCNYEFSNDTLNKSRFKYIVLLLVLTVLALKIKANALIIPIIIFIYLLFFLRKKFWKYCIYFFFAFLFINPLYPLYYDKGEELEILPTFSSSLLYHRLFLNNGWFYNNLDQTVPALFSVKESIVRTPNSVFGMFGFFFAWFCIGTGIFLLYRKRKELRNIILYFKCNNMFLNASIYLKYSLFFILWFFVVLFFYMFDVSKVPTYYGTDTRYLTIAIIPLLLLIFTVLSAAYREVKKIVQEIGTGTNRITVFQYVVQAFIVFFLLTFIFTCAINVAHSSLRIKGGFNVRDYTHVALFGILYEDYYKEDFGNFAEKNLFYREKDDALIPITYTNFDFLEFGGAFIRPFDELNITRYISNEGLDFVYTISIGKNITFETLNTTSLGIVNPCSIGFFEWGYCQLYEKKNHQPFIFYVSKVSLRKNNITSLQ